MVSVQYDDSDIFSSVADERQKNDMLGRKIEIVEDMFNHKQIVMKGVNKVEIEEVKFHIKVMLRLLSYSPRIMMRIVWK